MVLSILGASIKYHCIGIYNDIHYTCHCLLLFFLFHGPYYKCRCSIQLIQLQVGIQLRLLDASLFNVSYVSAASLSYIYTQAPIKYSLCHFRTCNGSVSYQRLTGEPSSHISPSIFPNPNCVYMIQRYFKDLPSIPINIRTHPRFELLKQKEVDIC